MKKTVAIDIGNTNISVGVFAGRRLIGKARIPTQGHGLYKSRIRGVFKKFKVGPDDTIVTASVVPASLARLLSEMKKLGRRNLLVAGRSVKVPILNLYKVKAEVGQDRLLNAFAARSLYGAPAVVVDFGTAITFDIVSRRGEYLGGLILPGIEMSLSALHENTALLPKVALKSTRNIIGKDTVSSMRGGILFGFGAACDDLVRRYKKILGKEAKIIATGGNARLIQKYARSIQIVDPDLTLKGLSLL